MGLYVHLSVNFRGIAKEAWEAAWQESLDILQKFPLPLFSYDVETKKGKERHVYSRNLVFDAGTEEECWYLEGDLLSRQSAETFELYRHLEAYTKKSGQQGCFNDSVFKTDKPEYWSSSNGMEIWDSKTQGYPFHLAVLEATEDVQVLLSFVENANLTRFNTENNFDVSEVLKLLCSDFIFIPPTQREYAQVLTQRSEDMQNIDDVFNHLFMQMSGMPYVSPLYVPADELLEIFALHSPEQAEEYHHIIKEYQEKLSNWIKKLEQTVALFEENLEYSTDESDDLESGISLIESYPLHEQYIVRQAIQQQDDFEIHNQHLPELKAALQVLIEKHPNLYEGKSVGAYLRGIYKYSFDAGWGLSVEGWQKLDQIKDVTLLKSLFAMATVDNHEITFWRWRKHIFEHVEQFV